MQNALGDRGEAIFRTLITEVDGKPEPRFRPGFLGEKWPSVDFLVELVDAPPPTPFFFVQVKTTQQGFTKREHRLRVQVKAESIGELADYPAPTYIAGIDEPNEDGWLLAVTGHTRTRLPSLPTLPPINTSNRTQLYDEVATYWQAQAPCRSSLRQRGSNFQERECYGKSSWRQTLVSDRPRPVARLRLLHARRDHPRG